MPVRSVMAQLDLHPDGRATVSDGGPADPASIPFRLFTPAGPGPFPSVIVLHGAGASGERWVDAGRALADAGLLVALPDARGHGRRGGPRASGDELPVLEFLDILLGTVADVQRVTDYLCRAEAGTGAVAVRGFSMGGQIALLAAARDRRLDPVCVVSGVFPPLSDDPSDYPASAPDGAELARAVRAADVTPWLSDLAAHHLLVVRGRDDPHVDAAAADAFAADLVSANGSGSLDEVVYVGGHHPPAWLEPCVRLWLLEHLGTGPGDNEEHPDPV